MWYSSLVLHRPAVGNGSSDLSGKYLTHKVNSFLLCYSAIHKTFDERLPEVRLKFHKFTMNLAISLRSCQSNPEFRNEVVNFTLDFAGKLQS